LGNPCGDGGCDGSGEVAFFAAVCIDGFKSEPLFQLIWDNYAYSAHLNHYNSVILLLFLNLDALAR
jgi:hypothetical protein